MKTIKINQMEVNIPYMSLMGYDLPHRLFFCFSGEYSELLLCPAQGQGTATFGAPFGWSCLGGAGSGNSNMFGIFTPKAWGFMIQFDFCIFFKGVGEKPPTSDDLTGWPCFH